MNARARTPGLAVTAAAFIAGFFLFFTWRGLFCYFTGDDLMNLYGYWTKPVSALVQGNLFFWTPYYRPLGGIIYRPLFAVFGFNPRPLYIVFYAAMLLNLWLAYLWLKRIAASAEIGAIAVLLWAVHGKFDYLYYNAGSMYDVFCFLFFSAALVIDLRTRTKDRLLGIGGTAAFLACLICALNSKEMAATLPVIVLTYELIFHTPHFRSVRALLRWCGHEGRVAFLGALIVLIWIPAKLGSAGLVQVTDYIPSYTLARWLQDMGSYLGALLYRNSPSAPLGVTPLTPIEIGLFFGIAAAIALWLRSRVACFGLLFFAITALPVSFIPARLGFVMYLPSAGIALYLAVCLVKFKEALHKLYSEAVHPERASGAAPVSAAIALFIGTALIVGVLHYRNWPPIGDDSPYKLTMAELSRMYPTLPRNSRLLFVHSALDPNWDLVFLLRVYYRDPGLFITDLNGPDAQRIPLNRLSHYDHIFDFENGHYEELENGDAAQSVQLHLIKGSQDGAFGEVMSVGRPGATLYIGKGVLISGPNTDGYWTLDQPELRFRLSSVRHNLLRVHFFLPEQTMKQTGPLVVDFDVNGHLLEQARFAKAGEIIYQRDVPVEWLRTDNQTTVQMRIHNPYIAPGDGARLGFILRSAAFSSSARS